MNLEKLSKRELLMLFSVLEGELEARDVVIEALKAQHKDSFLEERYGKYNISDPLLALQRDYESLKEENHGEKTPVCTNPLFILQEVMKQCKNMQERMLSQLAAAESRHRKVIKDLEDERQKHAQDTAEGDDVMYMLEKERERLLQQLEFEKSQVKKLEKEQKKLSTQLEEEKSRHKQLSSILVAECKKATSKAAEEVQRVEDMSLRLEKAKSQVAKLEEALAAEKKRGLQMEAQVEKQLSEFDIEREQLKAKLNREENRTNALSVELAHLKKVLADLEASGKTAGKPNHLHQNSVLVSVGVETENPLQVSVFCQTEMMSNEKNYPMGVDRVDHITLSSPTVPSHSFAKTNGHYNMGMQTSDDVLHLHVGEHQSEKPPLPGHENHSENGSSPNRIESPIHMSHLSSGGMSPSSTATSSLTSSPCSSPVLSRRLIGASAGSPGYQSSYQVGINQRFHAARHKFQSQSEQDQHASGLQSPPPRDLSPIMPDNSAAKQLARNTVTQVLSRFTSQQVPTKPQAPNSSPFGTDYRNLANSATPKNELNHSLSPVKVSCPLGPLSPGIKSPTIPRVERGHPPPIPPKKPGLAQSPASPGPLTKTSSQIAALGAMADMSSNGCASNVAVANGNEFEIMVPSSS
ncbi:CTTNBP2 N-terminal-like protein [Ambystoma mexicanum]|uniref:CTTNBP2 N-terminal-like protein n=1 Tax=Ambystoma mexicanum TaxID=8296 RepID=UPI0037E8715E